MTIPSRFNGPPGSANGGYACGLFAGLLGHPGAAEVTLRSPPPLDEPLEVEPGVEGLTVRRGSALVGEAKPLEQLAVDPRPAPSRDEAAAAMAGSPLHEHHPFPTCFVCGPARAAGDGMRLVYGPTGDGSLVAAPWRPQESLPSRNGTAAPEIAWAALDCASGIAPILVPGVGVSVLGRLCAWIDELPAIGGEYVVAGWNVAREGRKLDSAAAIFDRDGRAVARAEARWIELREAP